MLQRAADDKDLVVRNAVSRALREGADVTTPAEQAASARPDGRLRQGGRASLLALYTALRSLKLYPVENATVQKALDDLDTASRALVALETDLEIRLAGDFIFVNATRLRLELDNYASFSHILTMLRAFSIGGAPGARGGQPARVADLPEPAAQPVRAGRARRAVRGAGRAPGRGAGSRASRSSAPCTRSTIRTPSRRRSRPSGSTRRAWRSPRT